MNKYSSLILACTFVLGVVFCTALPPSAQAERRVRGGRALKEQCKVTKALPSQIIYKTVGSPHFVNDCRRNTIGLIMKFGARGYGGSCVDVLDSKGIVVAKLGNYGQAWSGGPARYYNCLGCSGGQSLDGFDIARTVKRRTGNKNVYFRFSGVKNICYGPVSADKCRNSVSC